MASLYVILGLAVLLPLSGLVDLMLASQRYDVSAGQQAATSSERIATVQRLFYQALASYATSQQGTSQQGTSQQGTAQQGIAQQGTSSAAPTIDATTVCPVFGGDSELQPVSSTGSQTLMTGCSYVSKSSPYGRLEVKSVASSLAPSTPIALAPKNIVITQACVVAAPQDGCLSAYSP
jgi:hypothetical protein